jgi:hypothetical protein
MLIATAVISYISFIFLFAFLPESFPEYTTYRVLIEIAFLFASTMTYLSLFHTAASDPGYLSPQYKHPLTADSEVPYK